MQREPGGDLMADHLLPHRFSLSPTVAVVCVTNRLLEGEEVADGATALDSRVRKTESDNVPQGLIVVAPE